jgi:hypothetical protein
MRSSWFNGFRMSLWRSAVDSENVLPLPSKEVSDMVIVVTTALSFLIVTLMTAVL